MTVSSTGAKGVVGPGTRICFRQRGSRVLGRYQGGPIVRGCLVGDLVGDCLVFRFVQLESSGEIHAGRSRCEVGRGPGNRTRIQEHFTWTTRSGSGTNVFDALG